MIALVWNIFAVWEGGRPMPLDNTNPSWTCSNSSRSRTFPGVALGHDNSACDRLLQRGPVPSPSPFRGADSRRCLVVLSWANKEDVLVREKVSGRVVGAGCLDRGYARVGESGW